MKRIIFLCMFILPLTIKAQEIGIGYSVQQVRNSLIQYHVDFDTVVEGQIIRRVTVINAKDVPKFGVKGDEVIKFEKPDKVTEIKWVGKNMSKEDANFISAEIKKILNAEPKIKNPDWQYDLYYYWEFTNVNALLTLSKEKEIAVTISDPTAESTNQLLKPISNDSEGLKSSIFFGIGGGKTGFAAGIGLIYKYIGIGITGTFADLFSEPSTTDAYPSTFLSSSTSSSKKYDVGYTSYDLLGVIPITSKFSIQGSIGYFTNNWEVLTTTRDNDGILSTAVRKTESGSYSHGISWGVGLQFNASSLIMVGINYSSINAILLNIGYRY